MLRVMLIDDEEDALDLLEILLGMIGDVKVVGRYTNPVRAWEELEAIDVDAVFLDVQMPGMKGTELARNLKAKRPQLHVVFTTAYSDYAVEAFEIQLSDYLLKPFTPDRLQLTVSRIRQAVFSSSPDRARRNEPRIQCLGGFYVHLLQPEPQLLAWRTNKVKEICAFLVHHRGKPVDTAAIVEAVWPEHDWIKARAYLYTCLSYLRRSLAHHGIPAEVRKVGDGFALASDELLCDVSEFEAALAQASASGTADERLYAKLNDLYEGDYMNGCDYAWAIPRQLALREKYVAVLRCSFAAFRKAGNAALAEDSLRRVLALAPDSEPDGRELIRFYLETGRRAEALKVFQQMEKTVRGQLGLELEEETVRLRNGLNEIG